MVFCFRGIDGLNRTPLIAYNNFYGGYLATKHLIEKGYRHIAFMSKLMLRTSLDRYQGYVAALLEAGLQVTRSTIVLETVENGYPHGYYDMRRLIKSDDAIDAVFCHADELVSPVYQAIRDCGKAISDDIGVISFDNQETLCMAETPHVTSLGGLDMEIGEKAAETLWKIICGQASDVPLFLMQPVITERESCMGPKNGAQSEF